MKQVLLLYSVKYLYGFLFFKKKIKRSFYTLFIFLQSFLCISCTFSPLWFFINTSLCERNKILFSIFPLVFLTFLVFFSQLWFFKLPYFQNLGDPLGLFFYFCFFVLLLFFFQKGFFGFIFFLNLGFCLLFY